jgi:hypothetical protein
VLYLLMRRTSGARQPIRSGDPYVTCFLLHDFVIGNRPELKKIHWAP